MRKIRSAISRKTNLPAHRPRSSGFTVVELAVSICVITVCFVAFAQLVVMTSRQRYSGHTYRAAVDQLNNIVEQLSDIPPERRATGDFDSAPYELLVERALPGGRIGFECDPVPDDLETGQGRELRVFKTTVSWSDGEHRPRRSVSLSRLITLSRNVENVSPVETGGEAAE